MTQTTDRISDEKSMLQKHGSGRALSTLAGIAVSEDCVSKFNELKLGHAHRYVLFKMNADNTEADSGEYREGPVKSPPGGE
jgi:hypothetical protein